MTLKGQIFKNNNQWLVEVPSLHIMTQGKTKTRALDMLTDAVIGLAKCDFSEDLSVTASEIEDSVIEMFCSNNELMNALLLMRASIR